ncbi:MAG: hydrogenase maturation protease [Nitrososphaerales archaeon]
MPPVRLVVEGRRGPRPEDHGNRVGQKGEGSTAPSDDLSIQLRECILGGSGTTHVFGIGNPIKQDDAVGLEVVSSLRRRLGPASRKAVRVHGLSPNPERMISDLASKGERIVIIDAIEAQKKPGTIICARLSETKFGFFATHNVPLRLVPGVAENAADTYIVGIEPDSVGVGEGLSDIVKRSSTKLVEMIASLVEAAE